MSCNIPFATQRKIIPMWFGSVWFIRSLAKASGPGQISGARCREQNGCWSSPGEPEEEQGVQRGTSPSSHLRSAARPPTQDTGRTLSPSKMMSSPHNFITVPYLRELLILWLIVLFYCSSAVWHIAGFCHWSLFWKTDFYAASDVHSQNCSN